MALNRNTGSGDASTNDLVGCQVFADETKAKEFTIVAAFVPPHKVHVLRSAMRGHRMRGQRSIHFNSERDAVRRAVLRTLVEFGVTSAIFRGATRKGRNPREACVRELARYSRQNGCRSLVLDLDESVVAQDRRWLHEELCKTDVRYDHLHRHEEPLLWVADAIAWCWQRGGQWRVDIESMINLVDVAP
ncbi:hypothetical protein [Myceligenerans xiligouense]|uniref:Uncharacterized protein n=1 Tax=Myceligenerans xiligouense TaxID=253184 RepID=A0A3N4YP07_9MICO|nr:hypothetical protein [Myceligenerans xiligouense]RPF22789.1 hypothetical protein EDD34_3461 [Myceligenerans xiligouense]